MQTIKIAAASLHYHRRQFRPMLICCVLLTTLLFFGLLLWNSMLYFDHQVTELLKETIFYGKSEQVISSITNEAKDLDRHYEWLIVGIGLLTAAATFFFSWHLLVKRQSEYQTMLQVGGSWPRIAGQLILELVLPIVMMAVLLAWIALAFQSTFIQMIENIHIKGVELVSTGPVQPFSSSGSAEKSNWMLMIPDRFSLLLRNVSVDGKNWLLLVGKSFGQSIGCLVASVITGILLFLPICYKRIRPTGEHLFKC